MFKIQELRQASLTLLSEYEVESEILLKLGATKYVIKIK